MAPSISSTRLCPRSARVSTAFSLESQMKTQKSNKRPYGVGLLVAGADKSGVHLYETKPDGNFYEYYALAIG